MAPAKGHPHGPPPTSGQAFRRNLRLYLWKNAVQKRRAPIAVCCEIATPIVFVGLMALLYAVTKVQVVPTGTFEKDAEFVAEFPFAVLPQMLRNSNQRLALVGNDTVLASLKADFDVLYPGFNATEVLGPAYDKMTIPKFSDVVRIFDSEAQMEALVTKPNYGTTGEPTVYGAIVVHSGAPAWNYSIRLNMSNVPTTAQVTDPLQRSMKKDYQQQYFTGITVDKGLNVYPGFMPIQAAMDRWIINRPEPSDLRAGIDVTALSTSLALYLNQTPPHLPPLNELPKQFLGALLNASKSALLTPQHVGAVPFPIHGYHENGFYSAAKDIFALFFLVTFLYPAFRLIRGIVHEKETKVREGMKMMGMGDLALFSAWYITYLVIFLLIAIGVTLVSMVGIFSASFPLLTLLYFFLFGASSVAFCFLISTIFSRAKTAAVVGTVLYTAAFFPYYSVNHVEQSTTAKLAASLCSPTAFGLSLDVIASFEAQGQGVNFENLFTPYQHWSFGLGLVMMAIDFALYTLAGWYLDNVLPGEWGVRKSWYFCCTRSYWTGHVDRPGAHAAAVHARRRGGRRGRRGHGMRKGGGESTPLVGVADIKSEGGGRPEGGAGRGLLDDDGYSSMSASESEWTDDGAYMPPDHSGSAASHDGGGAAAAATAGKGRTLYGANIEQVPQALRLLEKDDRCIKLRALTKQFETPDGTKTAVDRVSMTMYEGQIFALLGHNGAGKTTTISMLSGLIPPTYGAALVMGKDVTTEMNDIRHSMGVCPQHDVLFDDLTVREHLEFFAGLKGVPAEAVDAAVHKKIEEVGLTEKENVQSSSLSGGQKRKLSVAIALIGDSKVVFLDEPTSGMDPYSRRSTWNIIQNNREGRVIILTTHFMEEADLLGDRIAIMADGAIRCLGSSHFLKSLYGVGYHLTFIKKEECNGDAVAAAVRGHVPEAKVLTDVGAEMAMQLPFKSSSRFPTMFTDLDTRMSELALMNYGISVTTLEEVFLKVAREGSLREQALTQHIKRQLSAGRDVSADSDGRAGALTHEEMEHALQAVAVSQGAAAPAGDVDVSETEPAVAAALEARSGHAGSVGSGSGVGGMNIDGGGINAGHTAPRKRRWSILSEAGVHEAARKSLFWRHFRALFTKRLRYTLRDRKSFVFQFLIPVAALFLGLFLLKSAAPANPGPLVLDGHMFNVRPNGQQLAGFNTVPFNDSHLAADVLAAVPQDKAQCVAVNDIDSYLPAGQPPYGGPTNLTTAIQGMSWYLLDSKARIEASRYGALIFMVNYVPPNGRVAEALDGRSPHALFAGTPELAAYGDYGDALFGGRDRAAPAGAEDHMAFTLDEVLARLPARPMGDDSASIAMSFVLLQNTTAMHATPTYQNLANDAIYRWSRATAAGRDGGEGAAAVHSITAITHPLPFTSRQQALLSSAGSFAAVLFIVIAFSFIPTSFAVFIVKEREVNAKHQQLISGVSILAYWTSTFLWDILNYLLPCSISLLLIYLYNAEELVNPAALPATVALFLLYGLAVASFTYCLTYLFKSHSTAQNIVLFVNFLCLILLLISMTMGAIETTCQVNKDLKYVYRLLPGFALGDALLALSLLKSLPFLDTDCGRLDPVTAAQRVFHPWDMFVTGTNVSYLIAETVVYFTAAILIDVVLSYPSIRSAIFPDKDRVTDTEPDDVDVANEARRVASGRADSDLIVLSALRKVYGGDKVAVRDLSFGVPSGQVFGFLGINGAGKTSTLRMLSGDVLPTSGTARLAGMDVLTQQIDVRRLLGYCPQFDALLELLTVREHLELYARIKGVPEEELADLVDEKIADMQLTQFANKLAGTLSGGNKRKLSVAIAMIGDPPIMFLDEPSTGMDPVARRFMWNLIARIAAEHKRCSIILTTHSMEECEALCQRVGIMVGGRLRCLGSVQHLKQRFGRGYLAEVRIKDPASADVDHIVKAMEPFTSNGQLPWAQVSALCAFLGDPRRSLMVHPNSSGWLLANQFVREGWVEERVFAEWWVSETMAAVLHRFFCVTFPDCELVERHAELFRYRLPDVGLPLSTIFGVVETNRAELHIAEYSLSQTTLEQIFNLFASQQDEERGAVRGMQGGGKAGENERSQSRLARGLSATLSQHGSDEEDGDDGRAAAVDSD